MKAIRKFKHFYWGDKNILTLSIELGSGFYAYGAGLRFFGEDNTLSIALHWHYALYLGIEIPWLNRKVKSYEWGRRIGAHVSGRYLTVNLLEGGDRSFLFWDWVRAITGEPKYSEQMLSMGSCEVILPENRYPADFEVKRQRWTFERWGVIKQADRITVNIPSGIPVPGKGENSWDCGDDKIFSVSTMTDWDHPANSRKFALDDLAMNILRRRQKYASLDWRPHDEADEILEEHAKVKEVMRVSVPYGIKKMPVRPVDPGIGGAGA